MIFFRSKSQDIELLFNQIPKIQTKNIIDNYKKTFAYLSGVKNFILGAKTRKSLQNALGRNCLFWCQPGGCR